MNIPSLSRPPAERAALRRREAVGLVQRGDHRLVVRAQLAQRVQHGLGLLQRVRVGDVHYVQQRVGLGDFLQRGAEGGHQLGGQLLDEADGVGEEGSMAARQADAAGGGVERGEELVLGQHVGLGDRVEQGGFAGVGVADDGDDRDLGPPALGAVLGALAAHFFQFPSELGDALVNPPAVNLELGFAGAAQADAAGAAAAGGTAGLARQVRPLAGEARLAVFILRQLHLQRALAGAGVLGEDVQDQRGAIENNDVVAVEGFLQLALVARRKLVVEDDHIEVQRALPGLQLLHLAGADEGLGVGGVQRLRRLADHVQAGGLTEQGQLRERGFKRQMSRSACAAVGRVLQFDADQEGAL
jgi:hypothetical protein